MSAGVRVEIEHQTVKELVSQLDSKDGSTDEVDPVLEELKANVQHHVEEEESEAFPRFRNATGQATLQALADQVRRAKEELSSS